MCSHEIPISCGYELWCFIYRLLYHQKEVSVSLIPRPFPPPVFDGLQYAKTEVWEKESCAWRQVDIRVDMRPLKVPNRYNSHWSASNLPKHELYWLSFKRYSLKFLDKILEEGPQDSSLGTTPFMSTLMSTWRHARDSFSQAFPLRFCILQGIINWRRERPGNEARWALLS